MSSCHLSKKTEKEETLLITMRKTVCRGECPVYSVEVYDNGVVKYEGKKYVTKVGALGKKLSRSELKSLKAAFDAANFFNFEDEYTGKVTDLPSTFITYTQGEKTKTIRDHYRGPSELKALEDKVEAVVSEWVN